MKEPQTDKYYWVNRASERHISRMLTLATADQLQGDLMGVATPQHMMYRPEVLTSADRHRRYEFLIEYDIYNPSQGIYFGCKAITLPGYDHQEEIAKAMADWATVKPHVLQRLNNVFVDKDFTHRFKDTDNDNNNTFWSFWITLYEDEDPREVGVRALSVIAGVYRQLIEGALPDLPQSSVAEEKQIKVRTAFTEDAYLRLRDTVKRAIKRHTLSETIDTLPEQGWNLLLTFLDNAEKAGIIHRDECYERGWRLDSRYSDVDFKCMIQTLFTRLSATLNITNLRIPWNDLIALFLRSDGTAYKIQVKTLQIMTSTKRRWAALLHDLCQLK